MSWWIRSPVCRRRCRAARPNPGPIRWATPCARRWGRRPNWPCRTRWWWAWKTTRCRPRCAWKPPAFRQHQKLRQTSQFVNKKTFAVKWMDAERGGIDRKAATEKDDALNNCSHHLAHSKLKFRAPFTWLVPSSTGQPITTLSRKEWSSVEWIIYVSLNRPSYAIYRPPRWRESINRQSRRGKMRNQWKSWSFLVTAGSRRRAREKYSFSHPTEGIV